MILKKNDKLSDPEAVERSGGERGFSLIEMSVVLVIVGLLITIAATVLRTLTQSGKMAKEKATIVAVKNSLAAYALSRGKLPCPDTNGDGSGDCPVSSCGSSPCNLPYIDLNLSTAQKDIWSLPYHYDVTDILTTTNAETMCLVTYQVSNLYSWYGNPASASCGGIDLVCVTSVSDSDNGRIDTSGGGYYLAAIVVSRGEDKALGGKNTADSRREYEMSSNPYDITVARDDLVGEVTLNSILDKACTASNTSIAVDITAGEAWLDSTTGCAGGTGLTGTIRVGLGQRLYYKTGCLEDDSFEELAQCDLNTTVYTGDNICNAGTALNGVVSVDASAATVVITQ
jgi:prepilin-type N-terminal cleavage/methylation domain-containing protein